MLQTRVYVNSFAYFLSMLFGLLLYMIYSVPSSKPVEFFIFFLLFAASIGLVLRKEWGRKLLRASSAAGLFYFTCKQIFVFKGLDVTSLALMGIFVILIYFYRNSLVSTLSRESENKESKWTVLVVDDDLTFVKLVKSHFVKQGITVISSESGERGLEMAKRWKPDLIILDVILPGMKGRSVCAKLKEDSDTENIPVMFVTFKNSLDDISAEMELGAVMHLTKPVNYDHLYEQVHKILMKG